MNKQQFKADLALLAVAMFWGTTYVFTKLSLDSFPPINIISLRFVMASAVLALIFHKKLRKTTRALLLRALLLSLILLISFMSMNYGLIFTTASNGAFIIALTLLFVPICQWLFYGQKIRSRVWFYVALATVGIALLTLGEDFQPQFGLGELLSLGCAISYAFFIIYTERYARIYDPVTLSVWQMVFVGLFSTILSLLLEDYTLPSGTQNWLVILLLAFPCTALAYATQTVAQKYTSAIHTGLILSLETVFSGIFAYLILSEVLSPLNYLGAALMLLSIFLMELPWEQYVFRKYKRP